MVISNTSWLELNTHEPENAISFYSKTLGWEFESTDLPEGGSYWLARHQKLPIGGVFDLADEENESIPAHWMTYMQVDDVEKAQEQALEAGGEILRPILVLAGVGKLSVIADSSGALIGLIEQQNC